jgi:hypothetical protein
MVKFNTIQPFIPSGKDFEASKALFLALGFSLNWENNGYIGFQKDSCQFILQNYDDKHFAENLMMRMTVNDLDAFWADINSKDLTKQFDIKLKEPTNFPHGREINLIDIAGVCWHIAEGE